MYRKESLTTHHNLVSRIMVTYHRLRVHTLTCNKVHQWWSKRTNFVGKSNSYVCSLPTLSTIVEWTLRYGVTTADLGNVWAVVSHVLFIIAVRIEKKSGEGKDEEDNSTDNCYCNIKERTSCTQLVSLKIHHHFTIL